MEEPSSSTITAATTAAAAARASPPPPPSAGSATTQTVVPEAPILREWSAHHDEDDDAIAVAPAVVLPVTPRTEASIKPVMVPRNESESSAAATASSADVGGDFAPQYPVASLVGSWVQSRLDQISSYAHAGVAERVEVEEESGVGPLSIRSEADVGLLRQYAEQSRTAPQNASMISVSSEPADISDGGAILIQGGDLVEYEPPYQANVVDEAEYQARQHTRSRMRRGLRKIGKYFKRRKEKKQQQKKEQEKLSIGRTRRKSSTRQDIQEGIDEIQQLNRSGVASLQDAASVVTSSSSGTTAQVTDHRQIALTRDLSPRPFLPDQELEHGVAAPTSRAMLIQEDQSMNLGEILPITPITESIECREASTASALSTAVPADFIGTADLVSDSLTGNFASAEAFIENDMSMDYKTDGSAKVKTEERDLDSMLQQAQLETRDDVEEISTPVMKERKPQAKSTGLEDVAVPLSSAQPTDEDVFNDILKVVMVGSNNVDKSGLARAMADKKSKRPRASLGVDVHTWVPNDSFRCSIWDVATANAGAHSATQSLFFGNDALYILLWDLAAENVYTIRRTHFDVTDDEEEDEDDDYAMEVMIRQADRALEAEINENVLSWLDLMASPGSAILPVVTVPQDMDMIEINRRCNKLQTILAVHPIFKRKVNAPRLILMDTILKVNLATGQGIHELQETVQAIGERRVFEHVGMEITPKTMEVVSTIQRLKKDHKVILLDHLLSEMKTVLDVEDLQEILHFLSDIGEILYYGNSTDEVLSRYIILSRKWLVSALSCILRVDLQRELSETRRFMNLQSIYSGEAFVESDIVQTLLKGTNSSCPLLSAKDSAMLWQSMSFMRDAADRTAQLSEASNTMYDFLERLLVHSGILLPLAVSGEPTYFVPSLLPKAEPGNIWTYKTSDSWMTTLCHSWLLRDGGPSTVMEHVATQLLQDLYEFSHAFHGHASAKPALHHAKSLPVGKSSYSEVIDAHDLEMIGRIRLHQVMCWKSSILVKIGSCFADHDTSTSELRESFAEIYVAMVDDQSNHCVATDEMTNGQKRLIVCGKGQVGHYGRKLWKGGYALVLDSIKTALADQNGVDRQVVCPECLAHVHPSQACTWSWENVISSAKNGLSGVRCVRGHAVSTSLLCGTCAPVEASKPAPMPNPGDRTRVSKPVSSLLNSVVVVGLWDPREKQVRSVGSGFVVDKKTGLVITAGHVLFNMKSGDDFGSPYFGVKNAKAVIGVIPDDGHTAVWRYFAEIVSHDIHTVDACVLRITTRLENDVDDEGEGCADQAEIPMMDIAKENLPVLKMTRKFELEETVRILGFNQGGEGVREKGKHVNRTVDFAEGYICKQFKAVKDDNDSDSESSSSSSFAPREEIVVMCPTISGHSGGPFVNSEGKVVGILSRADPVDRHRCYLVPASELKSLLSRAKYQPVHRDFV